MTKQTIHAPDSKQDAEHGFEGGLEGGLERGVVITANDFFSGEVVYLGTEGWQALISSASIFADMGAAEQAMARAVRPDQVVGAYIIEVEVIAHAPRPVQMRERIRALGPTNYHHGKQEQAGPDHVSI